MSETILLWLFIALGSWCATLTGAIYLLTINVAKIRTILIITSKRAAEILHSPNDHLGIDQLLDEYKKHEHDLPNEKWIMLKDRCEEIIADPNCTKTERLLALLAVEFSSHKLARKY